MRDFFKSELKTLQAKTGLRQYENLSAMPDAEFQFKILLDSMVMACNEFPYIPDADKKRIIQEQIVRDQDFTGLNSRVIWKWLNANKDYYWSLDQTKQKPNSDMLKTFEELPDTLKKEIEAFKNKLIDSPLKPVPTVTVDEIEAIKREDKIKQEGHKALSLGYQPLSKNEIIKRKLHIQYVADNFNPVTGKPIDNFKEENVWLKEQGYYDIEGILIKADSEEQAQEEYLKTQL